MVFWSCRKVLRAPVPCRDKANDRGERGERTRHAEEGERRHTPGQRHPGGRRRERPERKRHAMWRRPQRGARHR